MEFENKQDELAWAISQMNTQLTLVLDLLRQLQEEREDGVAKLREMAERIEREVERLEV